MIYSLIVRGIRFEMRKSVRPSLHLLLLLLLELYPSLPLPFTLLKATFRSVPGIVDRRLSTSEYCCVVQGSSNKSTAYRCLE